MAAEIGVTREIVILRKKGCHLCEAVEDQVRSIIAIETSLTVVDIEEDSMLRDMYWLRIPVVRVEGQDVFEAKMMDLNGEWKERLAHLLK